MTRSWNTSAQLRAARSSRIQIDEVIAEAKAMTEVSPAPRSQAMISSGDGWISYDTGANIRTLDPNFRRVVVRASENLQGDCDGDDEGWAKLLDQVEAVDLAEQNQR